MYVLEISYSSKYFFFETRAFSFESLSQLSTFLNELLTTPNITVHYINIGPLSKPILSNQIVKLL